MGTAKSCGLLAALLISSSAFQGQAQTTAATFGTVIALGGTPSDAVLDEVRGRIYLVNDRANRVDVYGIPEKRVITNVRVGSRPLAAAMSWDGSLLYVTNDLSSSLSVIDLGRLVVTQTVTLPARPEGVAVGIDGRVLISTVGTGTGNPPRNTLLIFDRTAATNQQLVEVNSPPPPSTPTPIPPTQFPRPQTTFRGKLATTPDGQFIIGVTTPTNATYMFVYEVASGVILRSRNVGGQSTVLAVSPDGAFFMAGFTLYETSTLNAVAQMNLANAPFVFPGNFNVTANQGGSAFSPDNGTVYAAFNAAATTVPPSSPSSSTLFITNPQGLGIRLGIRVPESIVARILLSADGQEAWAISQSGLIYLPLGKLYEYPILEPENTTIFLHRDECSRGLAQASLRINNLGAGKLTFSVPTNLTPAIIMQATSGLAPADIEFTMEPGRLTITRQGGTNLATGAATMTGNVVNVNLASPEAINIPNTIRVYMNYRQPDQRGQIFPVPTTPNNNPFNVNNTNQSGGNEGLRDILLDEPRRRVYISNSGYNRIEVFDIDKLRFLDPIPVGQMPHKMELASDGNTLYVGETGGESISLVDLELGRVSGHVEFPPLPRAANSTPVTVTTLAGGLFGLQFVMSNGSKWKVAGNQALVRDLDSVTPTVLARGPGNFPAFYMVASPNRDRILTMAGDGQAFLYDSLADTYIAGRTLFTTPIQSYYGPLAIGSQNRFMLSNGLILNDSLTVIGGVERPGTVTGNVSGGRNVAAVAAINENQFIRLTTTVRQAINTAVRDELRTTLEHVDLDTGAQSLVGVVAENPEVTVLGTNRVLIAPRRMVVDSRGIAYALTISGLSVISTEAAVDANKPTLAARNAVVNANDGTGNFRPGSFITINGRTLASAATADMLPVPTVLGGSCVTFNDVSLPLLQTSPDQILAQIPEDLPAGQSVLQVRSLALAQSSDPLVVTVQR